MSTTTKTSAFAELGLKETIDNLIEEIQILYSSDDIPWIVGYSGGKDSSAVLSLVWRAIGLLPEERRHKKIHVISTDTLVENPVVSNWVRNSLKTMTKAAEDQNVPIEANPLTPEVKDTFWVNLVGRGYPAPRPKFRWCTERLKIRPANKFVRDMVRASGETILVLGTRKAESASRGARMAKLEAERVRSRLSANDSLPGSLVFSPIEDWSNDDVWLFLMQVTNPWGYDNKALLNMYRGASADNECPLVVDTTTPSCGDSRFGCWVCTLVEQDKSMSAMITNDHEKEWMRPLLELRNELDVPDDRHLRDFRRMTGKVQLFQDGETTVPGPYTQKSREHWLRKLLQAQKWVREHGPEDVSDMELITMQELHEIRRIWLFDKHEIEDLLPVIYQEETGEIFPGNKPQFVLKQSMFDTLAELCGEDELHYQMVRDLISVEKKYASQTRRTGLFDELEKSIQKSYYGDRDDALSYARERQQQFDDLVGLSDAKDEAEETATLNLPKFKK
jgi:DNA sulfur modification protein DndC